MKSTWTIFLHSILDADISSVQFVLTKFSKMKNCYEMDLLNHGEQTINMEEETCLVLY